MKKRMTDLHPSTQEFRRPLNDKKGGSSSYDNEQRQSSLNALRYRAVKAQRNLKFFNGKRRASSAWSSQRTLICSFIHFGIRKDWRNLITIFKKVVQWIWDVLNVNSVLVKYVKISGKKSHPEKRTSVTVLYKSLMEKPLLCRVF